MMCKGNVGLMFYGAGMIVADQTEMHLFIVVQFPSALTNMNTETKDVADMKYLIIYPSANTLQMGNCRLRVQPSSELAGKFGELLKLSFLRTHRTLQYCKIVRNFKL